MIACAKMTFMLTFDAGYHYEKLCKAVSSTVATYIF